MSRDRDWGSKPRSGGVASDQISNLHRQQRVSELTTGSVDLAKDPYFMKNHLGTFECKLCLTLHNTEGNYLAHTLGRKHQTNLARRAAKEAAQKDTTAPMHQKIVPKKTLKIGRPGYRVTKQLDAESGEKSLLFQVEYPDIGEGVVPRHRWMSSFEQQIEHPDKNFQYILFAAEPYETIGFKVPNMEVSKAEDKQLEEWNVDQKLYTILVTFKNTTTNA